MNVFGVFGMCEHEWYLLINIVPNKLSSNEIWNEIRRKKRVQGVVIGVGQLFVIIRKVLKASHKRNATSLMNHIFTIRRSKITWRRYWIYCSRMEFSSNTLSSHFQKLCIGSKFEFLTLHSYCSYLFVFFIRSSLSHIKVFYVGISINFNALMMIYDLK